MSRKEGPYRRTCLPNFGSSAPPTRGYFSSVLITEVKQHTLLGVVHLADPWLPDLSVKILLPVRKYFYERVSAEFAHFFS